MVSSPIGLGHTFTEENWDTPLDFTITGVGGGIADLTFSASGGGYDDVSVVREIYVGSYAVTVANQATFLSITEGETNTTTWSMDESLPEPVTVRWYDHAAGNELETSLVTISPATATTVAVDDATDANTVSMTAAEDSDTSDETQAIRYEVRAVSSDSPFGGTETNLSVSIDDDDVPPVNPGLLLVISYPDGDPVTTITEGESINVAFRLNSAAPGETVVATFVGDTQLPGTVSISPTSFTYNIANALTPQNAVVTAAHDVDSDDNTAGFIATIRDADNDRFRNSQGFSWNIVDDDPSGSEGEGEGASGSKGLTEDPPKAVTVSGIPESATGPTPYNLNFMLSEQPTGDVTITLTSDQDPQFIRLLGGPLTLTQSNWNNGAPNRILYVLTNTSGADQTATITVTASGGGFDGIVDVYTVSLPV